MSNIECSYFIQQVLQIFNVFFTIVIAKRVRKHVSQLCNDSLHSQCPSEVCQACFGANPNALWLAWLRCVNTDQHKQESTTVVVVNSKEKKLIKVRPLPLGFTQLEEVRHANHGDGACSSRSCQLAHSEDELLYWKWQVTRNTIFMSVSSNCCTRYTLYYISFMHKIIHTLSFSTRIIHVYVMSMSIPMKVLIS